MIAATIRRSPVSEAPPLLRQGESPRPTALPRTENSQKAGFGRSPPRSTPKIAVASGSRPMKTIECAEVMCCSASAVSSGKPTTTPSATMASEHEVAARRPLLPEQRAAAPRRAAPAIDGARRRSGTAARNRHRDARRRQRAAEDDHAEEAAAPAVRACPCIMCSLSNALAYAIGRWLQTETVQYNSPNCMVHEDQYR